MTKQKVVASRGVGAAFFGTLSLIAAILIGPEVSPFFNLWLGFASIVGGVAAVVLGAGAFFASTDTYYR